MATGSLKTITEFALEKQEQERLIDQVFAKTIAVTRSNKFWMHVDKVEKKRGDGIITLATNSTPKNQNKRVGFKSPVNTVSTNVVNTQINNALMFVINNSDTPCPINLANMKITVPNAVISCWVCNNSAVVSSQITNFKLSLSRDTFYSTVIKPQEVLICQIIGRDSLGNIVISPDATVKFTVKVGNSGSPNYKPPFKLNYSTLYFLIVLVIAVIVMVVYNMNRK